MRNPPQNLPFRDDYGKIADVGPARAGSVVPLTAGITSVPLARSRGNIAPALAGDIHG